MKRPHLLHTRLYVLPERTGAYLSSTAPPLLQLCMDLALSPGFHDMEQAHEHFIQLRDELAHTMRQLDEANVEVGRLAGLVAGWEETFPAAQAESEALRAQLLQQQEVAFVKGSLQ